MAGQQHACGLVLRPMSRSGTTIRPSASASTPNPTNYVPDVFNYAWREYGMRVGLWRSPTSSTRPASKRPSRLNSQVCDVHPKAIEEMKKRGWEFMGHGTTNSTNARRPQSRAGARHHPRHPEDDRAGDRQTAARLARRRTDRDLQHARYSRRGGRDLLRRLEQRRSALSR